MRRLSASANIREQEDSKKTTTRTTEMPAVNQGNQHNKHLEDPEDHSSTAPVVVNSNLGHSKPKEAQPGIYADLDITDMDSEPAYQPLNKGGWNVATHANGSNDPHTSETLSVIDNNHDHPESQEAPVGINEDPNSPTTSETTAGNNNGIHARPKRAQPGIYADLDDTNMDYEHAYQPLHKRDQNVMSHPRDPNDSPSTTPTVVDNIHDHPESQQEPLGINEDPGSPTSKTTAGSKNIANAKLQDARPGIYLHLDITDVDYEHPINSFIKEMRMLRAISNIPMTLQAQHQRLLIITTATLIAKKHHPELMKVRVVLSARHQLVTTIVPMPNFKKHHPVFTLILTTQVWTMSMNTNLFITEIRMLQDMCKVKMILLPAQHLRHLIIIMTIL